MRKDGCYLPLAPPEKEGQGGGVEDDVAVVLVLIEAGQTRGDEHEDVAASEQGH